MHPRTTKLKGAEVVNSWIQGTKVVAGTIIFASVPGKVAMNAAVCRYASSLGVAAFLTACAGWAPPMGAPRAIAQTSALATHAERGTSWMLPEAKSGDLLYVSSFAP